MKRLWLTAVAALIGACTRIDQLPGAYYPCHRDAGVRDECPGDWHCGLEERCLPNDAGPWACANEADCFGWHCGARGGCYELSAAKDIPCRADAGDCAPGWRCGVALDEQGHGKCHDQTIAAAYACHDDSDCEQGWRCGPDARCLDTSAEALVPNAQVAAQRIGGEGALWTGRPRLVSANNDPGTARNCLGATETPTFVDLVVANELIKLRWEMSGRPECAPDGGIVRWQTASVARAPLPAGVDPVEMISVMQDAIVLSSDGGVATLRFDGGALTATFEPIPFAASRLRLGLLPGSALAFGGTELARLESGQWTLTSFANKDAGLLRDVAVMGNLVEKSTTLIIGTTRGIFRAEPTGQLVGLGTSKRFWCPGTAQNFEIAELAQTDLVGDRALIAGRYEQTGAILVVETLERGVPDAGALGGCELFGGNLVNTLETAFAAPDRRNPALIGARPLPFGRLGLAALRVADGGLETRLAGSSGDFETMDRVEQLSGDIAVSRGNPRLTVFADAKGNAWVTTLPDVLPLRAITLSRVPRMLASFDPLYAESAGDETNPIAPFEAHGFYALEADAGFFRRGSLVAHAAATGAPSWVAFDDEFLARTIFLDIKAQERRFISGVAPLATFAGFAQGAVHAARHDLPDGGTLLVASAGDLLLSADLTDRLAERGPAPTLRPAVVPLTRGEITSMVITPGVTPGASHAFGYVVANGRLFRVRADNPVVWKSDELDLGSREAAAVWANGSRARVALRDGAVLSLPSRVQLAPPFAASSSLLDVAELCGNTFALVTGAVFRLVSDGTEKIGRWESVPVASSPAELSAGKLLSDGTNVHLVNAGGHHELLHAECVR